MRKSLGIALVALVVFALLPVSPASAADETYDLVFPVAGTNYYSDTWGAARSAGRTHQGTDIMADKMTPIVAAADGTVGWMHDEQGGKCCAMALNHDDGWASWYIHMNNDTPGTDDGQGWGFAPGITTGVHVKAGQLIGWVGDSGNAEWTAPHLHFELHLPDGTPINPYPSLVAAETGPLPRLAGATRYGTAAAISQDAFPDGSDHVYLATGTAFADALIAGPIAGIAGDPILLVMPDLVPTETTQELQRLAPRSITILGGEASISGSVADRLATLTSAEIDRIAGASRYETAAKIAASGFPNGADVVFVANGDAYPDALTGAAAAAKGGGPLLLIERDEIPEAIADELVRLNPTRIVILGGTGVVSQETEATLGTFAATVDRVWGMDRFLTAAAIARTFFPDGASTVYIATGWNFPDALAGTPAAAKSNAPILLTAGSTVPAATVDELARLRPDTIVILGGTGVVPVSIEYVLLNAIN